MATYASLGSVQNSGSSAVIPKPSGLAAGDLMVAFLSYNGTNAGTSWNTPSGWTSMGNQSAGSGSDRAAMHVFAKVADSSDASASDFTFTRSNTTTYDGVIYRITGTFTSASGNIPAVTVTTGSSQGSNVYEFSGGLTQTAPTSLLIMHVTALYSVMAGNTSSVSNYLIQTDNPSWTEQYDTSYNTPNTTAGTGSATATRTPTTPATGYYRSTFTVSTSVTQIIGALIEIADTANASPTINALVLSGSIPSVSPQADANVTAPSVITMSPSILAVTPQIGEPDWVNDDKPAVSDISNTDKP